MSTEGISKRIRIHNILMTATSFYHPAGIKTAFNKNPGEFCQDIYF
jgi:long-subunit fatty acid transport protein